MTSDSPSDDPPVEAASLARGADLLRRELAHLPTGPGVYRMVDRHEDVLYVGKARNVRRRVTSYTQVQRLPNRLRRMVAETTRLEVVTTHTEAEALLLESNLIKRLRPRYNILLRDDKSFPYILVTTGQEWPRLGRHRGARGREDAYFGPFASAGSVRQTLTALQRIFLLRSCSDSVFAGRSRPCLLYHIKRCCAPCVGRIDPAGYRDLVDQALAFLSGRSGALQGRLAAEMEAASEALEFEQAAALRDRIRALTAIQAHQDINVPDIEDADVLALHQAGGRSCLQVFFYRGGRNYGNRAYFPRHDQEAGPEDVLTAFLGQFYDNKPPPDLILLDREPAEFDLLREALALRAGHKVDIAVPRRGTRRKLVDHARDNAEQALARHLSESASQRRLLDQVADLFGLEAAPERIEVYDNSHIQGTNALGAMIVAGPDGFLKNAYRKWTIKPGEKAPDGTVFEPGDDYAMMRLVLSRRFARAQKDDPERARGQWPDLVLIDGGRGQLAVAVEALAELGVEDVVLAAIAKGPDRHAGRERLFLPGRDPVALPPRDPVLYYLQRLRDEAHRFAIGGHRQKRSKGMGRSALDEIPGIGPARKRALLNHFGSAKAVTRAGLADLELVEGISGTVARRIYDHFHGDGG